MAPARDDLIDCPKREMAPDVNGSTADSHGHSQHHSSNGISGVNGNGNGNHAVYLGGMADAGDRAEAVGGGAAAGAALMNGKNGRDFKRTNWTVGECLVLQEAKREDYERQTNGGAKEKHRTAAERWHAVEDFCWAHSVNRSAQQCKDRWEKMSADFKKVLDYERQASEGQPRFWSMSLDDKKARRLPSNYFFEVYKGLAQWFAKAGTVAAAGALGGAAGAPAPALPAASGAGGGRLTERAAENGIHGNLGSLHREREGKAVSNGVSNGNYSGSEDCESDDPVTETLFDSSSGKKRNSDGDVLMGDRNGGTSGRDYRRTNWTLEESIVLQSAKREDLERQHNSGPKDKHPSAAERWQAVEEHCWVRGIHRSGQQCRDRWDKLSSDFKKISDYEKQVGSGQISYWAMTPEEKRAKRLPSTFWLDIYNSMNEWFGKSKNIDLRTTVHDTSLHAPGEASGNEGFFGTDEEEESDRAGTPIFDSSAERERKVDGDALVGSGEGKLGREYSKTNWTLQECMVLQAAKQDDFERQLKEKHRKSADRWQAVEDFCWAQNIYRSSQQCKDRWEKMSVDFKKIYNHERHVSGGDGTYWGMTSEEKRLKRLPSTFWREVFNAMVKWFTKERINQLGNAIHGSEVPQQQGSGKEGSTRDFSNTEEGESDPVSDDVFLDSRSRKRRKAVPKPRESMAAIMEKSNLATQKIMLECEDRKDRRLEKSIEAEEQRLEKTLLTNERIAISYCQAFVSLADAIRLMAASGSHN